MRSIGELDRVTIRLKRAYEKYGLEGARQRITMPDFKIDIADRISLFDPNGQVIGSSLPGETHDTGISIQHEPGIKSAFRHQPAFIGAPVTDSRTGKFSVGMMRRLDDGDGNFAGVVAVSFDPDELLQLFDLIGTESGGVFTLFGDDGVVRGHRGGAGLSLGKNVFGSGIHDGAKRSGGEAVWLQQDGVPMLFAFRRVRDYPLTVGAGISRADALAEYRTHRNWWLFGELIVTAIILGGMLRAAQQRLALNRARGHALRSEKRALLKSQQLEIALENMQQGILMVDADRSVPVINRQAIGLLGLPETYLDSRPKYDAMIGEIISAAELDVDHKGGDVSLLEQVRCEDPDRIISAYERRGPNGTVLSVRTDAIPGGGFVRTITDMTEQRKSEERAAYLTLHDNLTQLGNRFVFRRQLEARLGGLGPERQCAVLCLDLDRFRRVNDAFGHSVGDKLLREVADRLRSCVSGSDVLARTAGDEFAILQLPIASITPCRALAGRLIRTIGQPYVIDGQKIVIGASVGVAVAPQDGAEADVVLKAANIALEQAKIDGRGTYRFFEPEMTARAELRRTLELDLRSAEIEREFELHYQPLVDLSSNAINGFEALLRWRHPERGIVPPMEFIPIAEELGLIVPIGEWALREACRQAKSWPGNCKVAVNLSPVQFRSCDVISLIADALVESGLPPYRLEIEITESALLYESKETLEVLHQLRGVGVKIAMDDFGTGYSSLNYLLSFPFDKIKIDQAFVKDLGATGDTATIVRAAVELARGLGMTTTAEGIENIHQLESLKKLGCDEVQGYLFSPPVPAARVLGLIASGVEPLPSAA